MKHNVHDVVVNQFTRSLLALKGLLKKSQTFATERKFDENLFLQTRMAPDMFPLVKQIQIVTDTAKGAGARLSGKPIPSFADEEKTISELFSRIDRTVEFLRTLRESDFENYAKQTVTFPWHPGKSMTGDDYFVSHALPNFYFHMTTAYNLMREAGVPIGKGDFLGEQNWKTL